MSNNNSQTFVADVLLTSFYKEMEDAFKEAAKSLGKKDVKKTLIEIISKFTLLEINIKIIRIFVLIAIGLCLYFLTSLKNPPPLGGGFQQTTYTIVPQVRLSRSAW